MTDKSQKVVWYCRCPRSNRVLLNEGNRVATVTRLAPGCVAVRFDDVADVPIEQPTTCRCRSRALVLPNGKIALVLSKGHVRFLDEQDPDALAFLRHKEVNRHERDDVSAQEKRAGLWRVYVHHLRVRAWDIVGRPHLPPGGGFEQHGWISLEGRSFGPTRENKP